MNKYMKYLSSLLFILLSAFTLQAQIEKVIVETYYVSDTHDATDTLGGNLPVGSTCYRIFVDLQKGYRLSKIYGEPLHALRFESDSVFFNNLDSLDGGGVTFARDLNIRLLKQNTNALDSWLTLGQVGKSGVKTYFGLPKASDNTGASLLFPNDGGSASIVGGLLANKNAAVGIPLSAADGLAPMTYVPIGWQNYGFVDALTNVDTTIFGSVRLGKKFESYYCTLSNNGVMGVNPDSNQVLIAQLTTKGQLSFELNVEVLDSSDKVTKIVAVDRGKAGEKFSPYLSYPLLSGCLDPNFLEYSDKYGRNDSNQCKTPIIFGCLDPQACNYDSKANTNIASLCCYPGFCNDRDLSIVCPALLESPQVFIYPNPSFNTVTFKFEALNNKAVSYTITNESGIVITKKDLGILNQTTYETIAIATYIKGIYHCSIVIGTDIETRTFIKQ